MTNRIPPCRDCGRPWNDGHAMCAACGRCFDDVKAFDAHRRRGQCVEVTR